MPFPVIDLGRLIAAPHEALDGEYRTFGIGDGLALGGIADKAFLVCNGNDRGRRTPAVFIGYAFRILAFHHIDTAVGRAKVYSNDLAHYIFLRI